MQKIFLLLQVNIFLLNFLRKYLPDMGLTETLFIGQVVVQYTLKKVEFYINKYLLSIIYIINTVHL